MAKMYPNGARLNTRTILNFMTTALTWNRCELFQFPYNLTKMNEMNLTKKQQQQQVLNDAIRNDNISIWNIE